MTSPTATPTTDTARLFDTARAWRDEPRVAMGGFLGSEHFRQGNRSHVPLPQGHKLASGSQTVYTSMFEKFLRHLVDRDVNMLTASQKDVDHFFGVTLGEASKETRSRYTRLLERTFGYLVATKLRETNPVGEWARSRGGANTHKDLQHLKDDGEPEMVTMLQVRRLHAWLKRTGMRHLERGEWRLARDSCLASLSLGTGLRCTELLRLKVPQVKHRPASEETERFVFDIKRSDTVRSALPHQADIMRECVDLMEAWWRDRLGGFIEPETELRGERRLRIPGVTVFPGNEKGAPLTPSTLYRSLKKLALAALDDERLDESTRWVLETGAQGLRKAYVLAALGDNVEPRFLKTQLGHHHLRSVRRVMEKARKRA